MLGDQINMGSGQMKSQVTALAAACSVTMLVALSNAQAQCLDCYEAVQSSLIVYWVSDVPAQQIAASSGASAFCPGVTTDCGGPADFALDISETGPTEATAECGLCDPFDNGCHNFAATSFCGSDSWGGATARTFPPTPGGVIMVASLDKFGGVVVFADPKIEIELLDGAQSAPIATVGSFPTTTIPGYNAVDFDEEELLAFGPQVVKHFARIGEDVFGAFVAECGSIGINTTFNSEANSWEFNHSFNFDGGVLGGDISIVSFIDRDFDLNEDDRFNQADRDLLATLIPSTNPDLLRRFDFNLDGTVDAADMEVIELLLANGFGSGVFGDFDDDGYVTCDDASMFTSLLGKTLCDEGYRFEADFNLDGVIDESDEAAFVALNPRPRSDLDGNGVVDGGDLGILLGAWGTSDPLSDLNGDGTVDGGDLGLMLGEWGVFCSASRSSPSTAQAQEADSD